MKKKAIIGGVAVMAIAAIAVWIIVRRKRKKEEDTPQTSGTGNSGATVWTEKNLGTDFSFPIKRGDSGTVVLGIQNILNAKFDAGLVPDGKFGSKTEAALLKYYGSKELDEANYWKFMTTYAV